MLVLFVGGGLNCAGSPGVFVLCVGGELEMKVFSSAYATSRPDGSWRPDATSRPDGSSLPTNL